MVNGQSPLQVIHDRIAHQLEIAKNTQSAANKVLTKLIMALKNEHFG